MTDPDKAPDETEEQAEPRKLQWRPRHNHLAEPLPRNVSFLSMEGATLPWHFPNFVEVVRGRRGRAGSPGARQCYAVGPGDVIVQAYEREGEEGTGMCLHFPREQGVNDLWSIDDDALAAAVLLKHAKTDAGRDSARDRFAKELARVLASYVDADEPVNPSALAVLHILEPSTSKCGCSIDIYTERLRKRPYKSSTTGQPLSSKRVRSLLADDPWLQERIQKSGSSKNSPWKRNPLGDQEVAETSFPSVS